MRTFLCFILLSTTIAAYAQRNELGFGGGFFQPVTSMARNANYSAYRGGVGYLLFDHNFNRKPRHLFLSVGVRANMFIFKEKDTRNRDKINHVWPMIAVPVGLHYRSHTVGNSLRFGVAIGPSVSMFPGADDASGAVGGLAEAYAGYTLNHTTLSVRTIRPLAVFTSETRNQYKGTALSLDVKFDIAGSAGKRPAQRDSVVIARKKNNPKAEAGVAYGIYIPFNRQPSSGREKYPEPGTVGMLMIEGIFDRKERGLHFMIGANLQGFWGDGGNILSLGGRLGAGYTLPAGSSRIRVGVQAGPQVTASKRYMENAGWLQTDAYANILIAKRASIGARYILPLNAMIGSVQTENGRQWADYNLQGIMLECKWRVSRR